MRSFISVFSALALCIALGENVHAQTTTVFSDNFDRASFTDGSTGGTPATTYNFTTGSTSTIGTTLVSGSNYVANINSGSAANRSLYFAPMSVYAAPFSLVLSANPGVITWTFNMRTNTAVTTTAPANGSMGGGIDLCGNAAGNIYSGSPTGYGVVFNSSATGGVALVKFSGGMTSNTVLITQVSTYSKTDYYSVKVTYDPSTNLWSLYTRDDGTTGFTDPTTGSLTLQGTATDITYTSQSMVNFGALYTWTAGTGKTMSIDNYTVTVTVVPCSGTPSASVNASSSTGCGFYTSNLTLSGISGSGYTFQWQTSPDNLTWTPVSGATANTYTAGVAASIYYRCLVTCGNSGLSANTSGILLTNTLPPSYASLPFTESFETAWLSRCDVSDQPSVYWANALVTGNRSFRREDDAPGANTASWGSPTFGAYTPAASSGSHSARFHSFQAAAGNTGALSLFINLGTPGTKQVSYDYINPSGTDVIVCQISTDGGSTFSTIDAPPAVAASWSTRTVTTTATSATAIIRFATVSDFGLDDIGLDNVNVTQLCATPVATGTTPVCIGTPFTFTAVPAGTWSSSSTTVATINSASGSFTALTAGSTTISCNNGVGCVASIAVTVNPAVTAISGPGAVCISSTVSLTGAGGGTWSSSNTSIATIGSTSGTAGGIAAGVPLISYTQSAGCIATRALTVNALPALTGISLSQNACYNAVSSQNVSFAYGGIVNGADKYTLTWSPAGPVDVGSFTLLPGSPSGALLVTVPAGTTATTYTGTLTVQNSITGCTSVTTLTLNEYNAPSLTALTTGASVCYDPLLATTGNFPYLGVANGANQYTLTWSPAGPAAVIVNTALPGTPAGTFGVSVPAGTAAGGYIGSLTVLNSTSGCTSVSTLNLLVNGAPALNSLTTSANLCYNALFDQSASFSYSGISNAASQYTLTWAPAGALVNVSAFTPLPGSPGGTFNVNVPAGTAPGIYTGTLVVKNPITGCTGTTTVTINVNGLPSLTGLAGSQQTCYNGSASQNVSFSYVAVTNGGDLYLLSWTPSGALTDVVVYTALPGAPSGTFNISVPAGTLPDTYDGTLTILNSGNGCFANIPVSLTVNDVPVINGLNTDAAFCYDGASVHTAPFAYTGSGGGADKYQLTWLPGGVLADVAIYTPLPGGAFTVNVPAGTPAGIYTGTLTVQNSITGCTTIYPLSVTINGVPGLNSFVVSSSVCYNASSPQAVDFTFTGASSGTDGYALTWTPPGVLTDVGAYAALPGSGSITVGIPAGTAAGSYSGVLTTHNSVTGCIGTYALTATVQSLPALTGLSGNSSVCFNSSAPQTGNFSYASAANGADEYTLTWSPGGGITDVSAFTALSPGAISVNVPAGTAANTYIGTLTIKNSITGCITLGTLTLVVNPIPAVTGLTTSQVLCFNGAAAQTATYNYTGTANSPDQYILTWAPGGVLADVNSFTALTAGNISESVPAATGVNTYSGTLSVRNSVTGCTQTMPLLSLTVNPLPVAGSVSGPSDVCAGNQITLTDGAPGGSWSSASTTIASVDPSGIVTGVAGGNATISFSVTNSCGTATATQVVSVNTAPVLSPLTGNANICEGAQSLLSDLVAGGTWTNDNTSVATVDGSGNVTGIGVGSTMVSYTVPNGCGISMVTANVNIIQLPAPIGGDAHVCEGLSAILSEDSTGGTWSSSNNSLATIDPVSGVVTGVSGSGNPVITYTGLSGCYTTAVVTINALPAAISGPLAVCAGSVITMNDVPVGGTWSSSDPGAAITSAGGPGIGIISGISYGFPTITYTLASGCIATVSITVNASPSPIGGSTSACMGNQIYLTGFYPGGAWSSGDPGIASVDPVSGMVTGIMPGTALISCTLPTGCSSSIPVTFKVSPDPIVAGTSVCQGNSVSVSDTYIGDGTWSTADPSVAMIAPIGPGAGTLTGISGGATTISYILGNGCFSTAPIGVNVAPAIPDPISGTSTLCETSAATLTDATPSGSWSSSNTYVASIYTTGIIVGLAGGTTIISYTVTNGCGSSTAVSSVTINPMPVPVGPVAGPDMLCIGHSSLYTDPSFGGDWTTTDASVATVSNTGMVTAISAGTTSISYTKFNSCGSTAAFAEVSVNPLPYSGTVSGAGEICTGTTTTLTDAAPGGIWSSGNTAIATVGSAGVVHGFASGVSAISYTVSNGCGSIASTFPVTIDPLPVPPLSITGLTEICQGTGTLYNDAVPGGAWSSSNTAIATVSTTGFITATGSGTVTIGYTTSNGCGIAAVSKVLTVDPLPMADSITGIASVCAGSVTILHDLPSGGMWLSDNNSVAIINVLGIVTGLVPGTATISYIAENSCGHSSAATVTVTVQALPDAGTIAGKASVCLGDTIHLSDNMPGGLWSSTNTSYATVNSSGIVRGLSNGADSILYTFTNSCGTVVAALPVDIVSGGACDLGSSGLAGPADVLNVYPNPSHGVFFGKLASSANKEIHIVLTDLLGRRIATLDSRTNEEFKVVTNPVPGVYLLTVTGLKDTWSAQITIK